MKRCPKCNQNMFAYGVDEEGVVVSVPHKCPLAMDLPVVQARETMRIPFASSSTPRKMKQCSYCKVRVKESNLARHLDKCPERPELTAPATPHTNQSKSEGQPELKVVSMSELRAVTNYVPCPSCKTYFRADRLTGHLPVCPERVGHCPYCHESMDKGLLTKHIRTCPKRVEWCPHCGVRLAGAYLGEHQKTCSKRKKGLRTTHVKERLDVQCPRCGREISQDIYREHLRICSTAWKIARPDAEGIRHAGQTPRPSRTVTTADSSAQDGENKAGASDLRSSDERDASKHWGHYAREHGRFGSYPVHDDFGDESEP
jgi:hypothetical protein